MSLTQKLCLGFLFALVLQVGQMLVNAWFTAQMQQASEQVANALAASIAVQAGIDATRQIQVRARADLDGDGGVDVAVYRVYVDELAARAQQLATAFAGDPHPAFALVRDRLQAVLSCLGELERAARAADAEQRNDGLAFLDDEVSGFGEALLQVQIHVRSLGDQGVQRARDVHGRPMRASLAITLGGAGLLGLFVAWFSRQLVIPIERAHAQLEHRVHERTAELGQTVARLQQEIQERGRAEARTRELHEQLVATSRRAGMAELANGVLHNVGNVLNSVNVSANVLLDRLQKSKADGLQKAVDLITQHAGDLAHFLSASPQGQKLPRYLATLATHLLQEREALVGETRDLSRQVDHMKEIVSRQQSYSRVCGTTSLARPGQIVDDVLAMHASSLQKHDVRVVRQATFDEECELDRSRVMQILMNLVANARHALAEVNRGGSVLEITQMRCDADHFRIVVRDNGAGIAAENLTRVFAHGFTTKRDGHGFGLHHSANSATEMGGRLWAESEGPGRGATFVLELPIRAPAPGPAAAARAITNPTSPVPAP